MNRAEYLKLCQQVSIIKKSKGMKNNDLIKEFLVTYDKSEYIPLKYTLSFNGNEVIHTAVLHDLQANSIVYADLRKVDYNGRKEL